MNSFAFSFFVSLFEAVSQPVSRRSRIATGMRSLCGLVPALLCVIGSSAAGQAVHFSGGQVYIAGGGSNILSIAVDGQGDVFFTAQNGQGSGSLLFASFANSSNPYQLIGFSSPSGVAVDAAGDLFILDAGSGTIDEVVAVNGSIPATSSPSIVTLVSGIVSPGDLAVDSQNNVYFTSATINTVQEILAVNNVIPPYPTIRTLGSGFRFPVGITVDRFGDVYVGDALNNAVKEIVAVNGGIPATPTILTLGSGFLEPQGLALDANGNLYVADYGNNEVKQILAVNGVMPPSPTIVNLGTYGGTQAVSVDLNGTIYIGDTGNNTGGSVYETSLSGANLGQTNVGSVHGVVPMSFTFDTSGVLGSTSVLTSGAPNLDFADAGTGSCKANTSYNAGQTCSVNVTFAPRFAGTRYGAVVLKDITGNVIATGYLQGTGIGPQVNFLPGTQSVILSGSTVNPTGLAVDGGGNLYVFNSSNTSLLKETPSTNGYTQTTVATGLSIATQVAVDGAGNVYIADTENQRVLKETPAASGYIQSIVATSTFGYPNGVAVDGIGNVYIAIPFNGNGAVLKESPSAGSYTQTAEASGLNSPGNVAVDGKGNLYISSVGSTGGSVVQETPSGGEYKPSTISVSSNIDPQSIAVDGVGDVFFDDVQNNNVVKETLTPGGYVESIAVNGGNILATPYGAAVDGSGNLYVGFVGYSGINQVVKVDFSDPPTLNFASTPVGTTSADSPQTVMVENLGNAVLNFPIPSTGLNPSIGPDFTLNSGGASACPQVDSSSLTSGTLAPGAICELPISYTPTVAGPVAESLTLTDNNLNAAGPAYALQSVTLNGTNITPTFTVGASPSSVSINQGSSYTSTITITPQTGFSVNATLSASGLPSGVTATFSQNPTRGSSVLTLAASSTATPGSVTITITGTFGSEQETATINLTVVSVSNASVSLSASPGYLYVVQGASGSTPITSTALNGFNSAVTLSTCSPPIVGVTVTFSPSTIPAPGTGTSTMTINVGSNAGVGSYAICLQDAGVGYSDSIEFWLYVRQSPSITWQTPAPITYGTALSGMQLNASSTVAGTFSYSPAAGTVLTAGTQNLNVTFTPTDTTDYTTATASVQLMVNKATPTMTWGAPAPITYGTALSAVQLNASSPVPGTFSYSPAAGTVLTAGSQTLTVTFTPTDTTDYATATASVILTVNKATPWISWANPAAITYGTALNASQLNATASVPGTFVYSPASGTVPGAGLQTLVATFTPSDATDYTTATKSVTITVNKATPQVSWPTPSPITYGTALSGTQLNATAIVPGTFVYSPAAGTLPPVGTDTLSVTFTPTDSNDYATVNSSVMLTVNPAPGFTLTASPATLSVTEGSSTTSTITVNQVGGFSGNVKLAVTGLPSGVTASFSTNPTAKTSVLTLKAATKSTTGTVTVIVTGTSGSLVQSVDLPVTVVARK